MLASQPARPYSAVCARSFIARPQDLRCREPVPGEPGHNGLPGCPNSRAPAGWLSFPIVFAVPCPVRVALASSSSLSDNRRIWYTLAAAKCAPPPAPQEECEAPELPGLASGRLRRRPASTHELPGLSGFTGRIGPLARTPQIVVQSGILRQTLWRARSGTRARGVESRMAKSKKKVETVFLVCDETGDYNYTLRRKTGGEKLKLSKYSPRLRKHTLHTEKKK